MKLFILVSSLDLRETFSATPAWWQLMKGLYEIGVEVVAAPYQGPAIESPWWRASPNPARLYGDVYKRARDVCRRLLPPRLRQARPAHAPAPQSAPPQPIAESPADRATRALAQTIIAPIWRRHLDALLTRERDFDAILILTAPLNHLVGVAEAIQRRHGIPVLYYDGDVPASLPTMEGFDSGFRIYQGANLREYAAFISNSLGGALMLRELGAPNVHTVYYGVDPDLFLPVDVPGQDIDLFFYGHGREYRDEWIEAMISAPSRALPDARFAARGTKLGDLGRAELLPYLSFNKLREYACRSRINLCITRAAHASVFASSSSRPFELASLGCCIVSNPYLGVETWFEPNKELISVASAEEALDRYRYLLAHDAERRAIGEAARRRVLAQHTHRHRARDLVGIVRQYA